MPPKRKRSSAASVSTATANGLSPILHETPIPPPVPVSRKPPPPKRQASRRSRVDTNPDHNADIIAKKGSDEIKAFKAEQAAKKSAETKIKKEEDGDEWDKKQDPDGDDAALAEDVDTLRKEAARPPPVNSDYLPLPWKGRLGYVSTALKNT
jgi:UV DNA damage endonuclease